jgi:hypothetical protein
LLSAIDLPQAAALNVEHQARQNSTAT